MSDPAKEIESLRVERDSLLRHPDISECAKGHRFRTIASHPAKNEREWECPHCAIQEREQLRRENAAMREAIREASKLIDRMESSARSPGNLPMCPECLRIAAWDEEHRDDCQIGTALAKLKPFTTP